MNTETNAGDYLPCPCCGTPYIGEQGTYEICDVCGWEDDPLQASQPDRRGGANTMSLNEARKIWTGTRQRIWSIIHDYRLLGKGTRGYRMSYDTLNRCTGATYTDSSVSFGYDAIRRLTSVTDSVGGTITWAYDSVSGGHRPRLQETITPGTVTVLMVGTYV